MSTIKKADRKRITPRFTSYQIKIIDSLVGKIGTNRSDVVSKLIIMWLHEKGYLSKEDNLVCK